MIENKNKTILVVEKERLNRKRCERVSSTGKIEELRRENYEIRCSEGRL